MTEPRRLKDAPGSELERALLRAGTSYRSPTKTRVRTLMALGLAGSLTGITSNASASLFAKSSWLKLVAISAIGVAATVPVVNALLPEDAPAVPRDQAAVLKPAALEPIAREPVNTPEPVNAPAVEAFASTDRELAVEEAPLPPSQDSRPLPPKSRPLGSELTMLDAVRVALGRGDTKQALGLLDAYAKSYPRGSMRLEAEVLRIDAYAKAGQAARAKKRALAFLKARPNSVFAARVQSYLRGPEDRQN